MVVGTSVVPEPRNSVSASGLSIADAVSGHVLDRLDALRKEYSSNDPFPHIVIDNFLRPEVADFIVSKFPRFDEMPTVFREPMSYKGQLSDIDKHRPAFSDLFRMLQSAEFRLLMERISGINNLLDDPMLAGGGLHQSPKSGFLDLHVDANFHPFDKTRHRRVNILIYVTPDWQDEWGGALELWSDRDRKPDKRVQAVSPRFNRAVIFSTTRTSWHGVSPIVCPEGRARRSLALYYYTKDRPPEELYSDSSVIWMNRSVPWKRALFPVMNLAIAGLKPYAKYLRRRSVFDAQPDRLRVDREG